MKIKERKYKVCKRCGANGEVVQWETYGCDTCKKQIGDENGIEQNARLQVFSRNNQTVEYNFCSWKCLFRKIKSLKSDYFITLPYLSFDDAGETKLSKEFVSLIDWKKVGHA